MRRFEGRSALITGAARGMGRSHAMALAREGADMVISDLCGKDTTVPYSLSAREDLDRAVEEIRGTGARCLGICADVSRGEDVKRMVEEALKELGKIDILVNNAGIAAGWYHVANMPEEVWDRAIAVNLKGTYLCCHYVLPSMIERRYGRIVNISSVAGIIGFEGHSHYTASKHGVIGLTKSLAQEVAKYNITVNAVCPGRVATPMTLEMAKGTKEFLETAPSLSLFPDRPMMDPEEITSAVIWLASEEARSVTGSALVIDQGYTCK